MLKCKQGVFEPINLVIGKRLKNKKWDKYHVKSGLIRMDKKNFI